MFSLFKNLFNKPAEEKPAAPTSPPSEPTRAAKPASVAEKKVASATPVAPLPTSASVIPENETISVSLKGVIATLPDTLKSRTLKAAAPDTKITVPLADAIAQLAKGGVKITFGQLRLKNPDFFTSDTSQDATLVTLPLGEILPQIRPDQLPRRNQKRVDVPDEVTSVFGGRGSETARVASAPLASPSPSPAAEVKPAAPVPDPPKVAAVPTPKPVAPVEPSRTISPIAPAVVQPAAVNPAPVASSPKQPAEEFVAPEPKPVDNTPIKPSFSLPDPAALRPITTPVVPEQPIKPVAPLPPATELKLSASTPAVPSTAASETTAAALRIPLATIIGSWPEGVRSGLSMVNQNETTLVLPLGEVETGLRKGKVQFFWKQIRSYLAPPVEVTLLAEADEAMLELPLAVLAPLFVATKRPATAQKKTAVGENIPDLFKPKPPEPAPVVEPTPAPAVAPAAPPEPVVVAKKPLTPSEVIQQALTLANVTGAIITTTDGLLVDAQLALGLDAAKVAAFVPQTYLRVTEFAKAMGGSESNIATLHLADAPVAIFKHANIFCAVAGKSGESLPLVQLAALLNELAAQPK